MDFPKGTCVVLMRHAETEWTRGRLMAFKKGHQAPARIPDKQDANLSPFGRVQAFLAGLHLRQLFATGNGKPRCDSVAYSEFRRAEQTANWAIRAACLNPRYTAIAKELNEQAHAAVVSPELAVLLKQCVELANSGTLDPQHALLFRGVLDSLAQNQPQPFPSPLLGKPTPGYGLEIGMFINLADAIRRNAERFNVYSLKGEDQRKAWRKVIESASRSLARTFGAQALPSLVEEETKSVMERRKTVIGENFLNLVPRAEFILRHLKTRVEFFGERRFLIVSHSKICVAIRQLLEGLDDEEVSRILESEGPPFPPYVGMTVYRAVDGVLVREGEPYRLPPLLRANGRELEVVNPSDAAIEYAQKVTGTQIRRVRRNGRSPERPRHAAWTFEDSDRPRQAVVSSPYSIIPAVARDSDPPGGG